MKYGLSEDIITNIQRIVAGISEVDEVRLYGSRAKGNYKTGSDIDLAIMGPVNLSLLNKISLALDDLFLPYTFDLSAFNQIDNTDLIDHIKRVGISIYKR
jgi:uncharacterized protein